MKKAERAKKTPASDARLNVQWVAGLVVAIGWMSWVTYRYFNSHRLYKQLAYDFISFFHRLPTVSVLIDNLQSLLIFFGIILLCYGMGRLVIQVFKIDWNSNIEKIVFTIGLGYGCLSNLMFLMAITKMLHSFLLWTVWLLGTGGTLFWISVKQEERKVIRESLSEIKSVFFNLDGLILPKILLWVFLILDLFMCFVPELFYDALVYHIGVPNNYLRENGMVHIQSAHSAFPLSWQMVYMFGIGLKNETLSKLTHFSCGLLIILCMYTNAKRYILERRACCHVAVLGGLFFLGIPMVQTQIWTSGIDIGLCFYSFLAFSALTHFWNSSDEDNERKINWIYLAGAFAGLSFASKYQGVFVVAVVGLLILLKSFYDFWKWRKPFRWKPALIFGILSFLLILPWLTRNWIFWKNPVYPFEYLNFLFKDAAVLNEAAKGYFWGANSGYTPKNWFEILQLPWILTFNTDRGSLSYPGAIPLAFILIIFLYFYKGTNRSWTTPFILSFLLFSLFSIFSTRLLRYHLAAWPTLCFLLAVANISLIQRSLWIATLLISSVLLLTLNNLGACMFIINYSYHPYEVLSGHESREDYVSYSHPGNNPYPAQKMFQYLKKNFNQDHRVLIFGDEKTYGFPIPYIFSDVFEKNIFSILANESENAEQMFKQLQERSVTHMLVNPIEYYRLGDHVRWSDHGIKNLILFWNNYATEVHREQIPEKISSSKPWLFLYKLALKDPSKRKNETYNPILDVITQRRRKEIQKKS